MTDILALSPIDIAAKFGPTGIIIVVSAYLMRSLIPTLFKHAEVRAAANADGSDKLIHGTLNWASEMQRWAQGVQQQLEECLTHHAECNDKVASLISQAAEKDARIAALETQSALPGMARQMAQQVLAEKGKL